MELGSFDKAKTVCSRFDYGEYLHLMWFLSSIKELSSNRSIDEFNFFYKTIRTKLVFVIPKKLFVLAANDKKLSERYLFDLFEKYNLLARLNFGRKTCSVKLNGKPIRCVAIYFEKLVDYGLWSDLNNCE